MRDGTPRVAIVGGGPAGLMAAEAARADGAEVDLYDRMGSVGRKFLIAGKGGLNLTHSAPRVAFDARYGARREEAARCSSRTTTARSKSRPTPSCSRSAARAGPCSAPTARGPARSPNAALPL